MTHGEYLEVAKSIKKRRKRLNLTAVEFAKMCGCGAQCLSNFENGNFRYEEIYLNYYKVFDKKLRELETAKF